MGEALTPNKPATKATTPNLRTVNNKGIPSREPLGNRIIAVNHTNTTTKLIREALLTGSTKINTDQFTIQDDILKYSDKIWVPEALRTELIQGVYN